MLVCSSHKGILWLQEASEIWSTRHLRPLLWCSFCHFWSLTALNSLPLYRKAKRLWKITLFFFSVAESVNMVVDSFYVVRQSAKLLFLCSMEVRIPYPFERHECESKIRSDEFIWSTKRLVTLPSQWEDFETIWIFSHSCSLSVLNLSLQSVMKSRHTRCLWSNSAPPGERARERERKREFK